MAGIGDTIGNIGKTLGLPELGISEKLGGTPTPVLYDSQAGKNYQNIQQGTGGSNITSQNPIGPGLGNYGSTDVYKPTTTQQPTNTQNNNGGGGYQPPAGQGGVTNNPYTDPSTGYVFRGSEGMTGLDEFNKAIDSAYSDSYNYLNQAEGALRSDLPNVLQSAQTAYDTNANLASNQKSQATGALDQNATTAQQQYESALSAARRLYSQLQQGYQQRFGGSSSAGQAASEIAGVEQQRQQGNLMQSKQNVIQQIETQRQTVEQNYNQTLLQLNQQKQSAIDQANRDFQNKLLQINQSRAQLGQDKAQARLGALQELRNQVFQINQQNAQFQQALELQKQQAQQQLSTYSTQLTSAQQSGQQALGGQNLNYLPSQPLTVGSQGGTSASPYVGAIKKPEDEIAGVISNALPYKKLLQ